MFNTFVTHEETGPSRIEEKTLFQTPSAQEVLSIYKEFTNVANEHVLSEIDLSNNITDGMFQKSYSDVENNFFQVFDIYVNHSRGKYMFYMGIKINDECYETFKELDVYEINLYNPCQKDKDKIKAIFCALIDQLREKIAEKYLKSCEEEMAIMER